MNLRAMVGDISTIMSGFSPLTADRNTDLLLLTRWIPDQVGVLSWQTGTAAMHNDRNGQTRASAAHENPGDCRAFCQKNNYFLFYTQR